MGPLTIIYLLHNFHNSNSWIIRFFFGGPFSFELDKFDCTSNSMKLMLYGFHIPRQEIPPYEHYRFKHNAKKSNPSKAEINLNHI